MRTLSIVAALLLVGTRALPTEAQSVPQTPVADYAPELAVAGVVALATGLILYAAPTGHAEPAAPHWRGGILFDDVVRSGLRLQAPADRQLARTFSDVAMTGAMALAVTDAYGVPLAQGDPNLSWQAGFAYSLTLGLTMSLGELFKRTVGRARPYEGGCTADPTGPGCMTPNAYASFYSLHTSVAFASAGFSCAMHLSGALYGSAADAGSCAASLLLATLTGALRTAADEHYLSDVVIAAVVGFVLGYLVPLFLVPSRAAGTSSVLPTAPSSPAGFTFEPTITIPF